MLEALDFFFFWCEQNRLLFAAGVEQNALRFVWGGGQNCCSLAFVVAGVGRVVQSDRFFCDGRMQAERIPRAKFC